MFTYACPLKGWGVMSHTLLQVTLFTSKTWLPGSSDTLHPDDSRTNTEATSCTAAVTSCWRRADSRSWQQSFNRTQHNRHPFCSDGAPHPHTATYRDHVEERPLHGLARASETNHQVGPSTFCLRGWGSKDWGCCYDAVCHNRLNVIEYAGYLYNEMYLM